MLRCVSTCAVLFALICASAQAQSKGASMRLEHAKGAGGGVTLPAVIGAEVLCVDGTAAGFSCSNVDLMSFLPVDSLEGADKSDALNDIWGWTDPMTGREYALVGRQTGVSFVDVSDPVRPLFLGELPMTEGTFGSTWRDVKVYDHYALVVADNVGQHGIQIFDLHQLRSVAESPVTFSETSHYDGISSAHNIVVNEQAGHAYAVASSGGPCGPGLHIIDISDPLAPERAGCFLDAGTGRNGSGYTHDAQCLRYDGPDEDYAGRDICFGSNETALSIADVTDPENPIAIARATYPNVHYAHQGWLTEDQSYFLMDDELDEPSADSVGGSPRTRTIVWDVSDLDEPVHFDDYFHTTSDIDHNQYVVGNLAFQSNYKAGLRVLDVSDLEIIKEIAYFDTSPTPSFNPFLGAWSSYPFFPSGNVVVSSINEGLFVLRPRGAASVEAERPAGVPTGFKLHPAYPNPFNPETTIELDVDRAQEIRVAVYDLQGRRVAELFSGFVPGAGRKVFSLNATALASGVYVVRAAGAAGTQSVTVTLQK